MQEIEGTAWHALGDCPQQKEHCSSSASFQASPCMSPKRFCLSGLKLAWLFRSSDDPDKVPVMIVLALPLFFALANLHPHALVKWYSRQSRALSTLLKSGLYVFGRMGQVLSRRNRSSGDKTSVFRRQDRRDLKARNAAVRFEYKTKPSMNVGLGWTTREFVLGFISVPLILEIVATKVF